MKSGFIAILGKPNAGKSTLLNALVGEKVSIVSFRPQTTRNKIIGILNGNSDGQTFQAVFIDTPGLQHGKSRLSKYMEDSVRSASYGTDIIIFVLDGEKSIQKDDFNNIESYKKEAATTIVVLSKIDSAPRELTVKNLTALNGVDGITVVPVSAIKGDNIEVLINEISKNLVDGAQYYPEDMVTDKTLRFMAAEIIREKALLFLREEIPHGIGIKIVSFEEKESGVTAIEGDIITEKDTHKSIIIGKKGETLKRISSSARIELEKLLNCKVFLKLWVKIKAGWKDNEGLLYDLGYDPKEI